MDPIKALATSLLLFFTACAGESRPRPILTADGRMPQLVGRWIYSPGDSTLVTDPKAAESDDAIESPVGATLSLGEGGVLTARAGEFVRRGTWKINSGELRMIIDPPPERRELAMVPVVELDRLTLSGSNGMVLVYHRDPFVSLQNSGAAEPATPVSAPTKK